MYNLHLSPEQLDIRDTLRDFVTRELKPAAVNPIGWKCPSAPCCMAP